MPALDMPITSDDRGLKKVLGQKQPAIVVLFDGSDKKDKPLLDAMKREAKKNAGELLVVRVDVSENPNTLAKYDHPEVPALVALTPAFFGRKIKSSAESIRPSDFRAHVDHLLNDAPLPEETPHQNNSNGSGSKKPVKVTEATFRKEVLRSKKPVLVDFWAVWCGPCQTVAPYVDRVANEYSGKLKVAKVNVDENPRLSGQFAVQSIPTFMIFEGGQPVARIAGANPTTIKQMIDEVLV